VHAVVATVDVEDVEAGRQPLQTMRLDIVARAPGFVAAYWLEPVDDVGMSVILFDSREHAEAAAAYPLPALPGITPRTLEIREVLAHVGAASSPG
jgi:hypothetical protein